MPLRSQTQLSFNFELFTLQPAVLDNESKTTNDKQLLFEVMMKKNKHRKLHPRANRRSSNFLSKRLGKIAPDMKDKNEGNYKNGRNMKRNGRKRGTTRFGLKNKNV